MPYAALYHTHASFWVLTLLLFFISYFLLRGNKLKGQKITHMILRLFFVIMLLTGLGLVINLKFMLVAVIKMLVAIWLIAAMELILVKGRKGESTGGLWVQFLISIIAVLVIGYGFL